MSTETLPVPATPPAEAPAITKTAQAMTAEAFGEPAPTKPTKPSMPATKTPAATQPPKKADAAPAKAEVKAEAPPAKAEVAPVATPAPDAPEWPGEKMELPANASPEAKTNFSSMKASMKQEWLKEKNARAEAEKQLATYRTATPADTAEITAKEARLKAAEDRLAILDLQSHPDFVRQFSEPKNKALATATEVMQYNEKPIPELAALLTKPLKEFNAAVSEFTKDMNSADAAMVATSLRDARNIQNAEQAALAKSGELRSQIQAKTAQQQKQAFELEATEFTTTLKPVPITDAMTAEEKADVTAYNQELAGLRTKAESRVFGKTTERDVARMAFTEATYHLMQQRVLPGLVQQLSKRDSVIKDLTAQLESLRGTRAPNPGGGDTGQAPAKQTRAEMIAAAFPGQRV